MALDKAGAIYFNGMRSSLPQLAQQLAPLRKLWPEHVLFLETEMGVQCDTLYAVRATIDEQLECGGVGHCDEGISALWENLNSSGPIP